MTLTRGYEHTFVVIDIEFNQNGTATLSMDQYIKECVQIYGNEIKRTTLTPAKGTLFDDDKMEISSKLSEK